MGIVFELKSWSDPPLTGYKEVGGKESYGEFGFGVRIIATVNRKLTAAESTALDKAIDIIEGAIREENIRQDAHSMSQKEREHDELLSLFPEVFQVEELPNGYCPRWCCKHLPWYRVLTRIGWIKVGWRKSVINIDWSDTVVKQSGADLFPGAAFTVGSGYEHEHNPTRYCHAHGIDAARSQLAIVLHAPSQSI